MKLVNKLNGLNNVDEKLEEVDLNSQLTLIKQDVAKLQKKLILLNVWQNLIQN